MRKQEIKMMGMRYLLLVFMLGAFTFARAQEEVYKAVEVQPEFPGGIAKFYDFLTANIKYPAEARKDSVQGRAIVTFVVEADGSLTNITALRAPNESLGAEAVRVVSVSPKWNPGLMNGRKVRVQYTLPIVFSLNRTNKPGNNLLNKKADNALYVVNGKKVSKADLLKIKPNDIQSVNILKGDAAVAVYGKEGKNGVVQITLKSK